MGISDRKERERLEMRELILTEATRMFAKVGYEETSIRAIAKKIEYSPATIYNYFTDKDDLLMAVQEVAFNRLLVEFAKTVSIESPLDRLYAIGRIYVEFALANPEHYQLMFILAAPMKFIDHGVKWEMGNHAFGFLRQTVQECMDKGLIKHYSDSRLASVMLWGQVHGLVSLHNCHRLSILQMQESELHDTIFASLQTLLRMLSAG
ncbi:MAG: TetR/AcrR family transcriptional regulator [Bacteroidetes bacterium]|jgi:AcrR family transcriptional regulator|nr:MAG: TetR/AcrR family transcriptional regulator [Bacteroidota bacterium]